MTRNTKERGMCMKKKKGISLIVLIITIIVVIILAVTVILTITKNNPIESVKEAVFKEDVRAFQDELNMYISNEYTRLQGQRDIKITAKKYEKNGGKDSVYTYIPDFKKKYEGKLAIKEDMIAYVGTDEKEKEWLLNSGVYMAKTLTVKYVDQDGNKLKEDESMPLMDNYYSVDVPEIEGYIRFSEKLEGKISQDIEVIAEYYLENDNLAFMGLDASGKETIDEASIVSYEVTGIGECNVSKIAIPREHNSKPVIKIKDSAFVNNKILKSVIIGDNIESIENNAFYGCKNITQVYINCKNIGYYAFRNSTNLEKVIIGKNVMNTRDAVFESCSKLSDFTLLSENIYLNNVKIGHSLSLKEIKVNEDNNKYMVEDGILFSKDGSKIYVYPEGKIGETYVFDNNIKEIGDFAFYGCTNLKEINIPNTVNKIGVRAFEGCSNLEEVYIDANTVKEMNFRNNLKLKSVTIGKNVKSMSYSTFSKCSNLSEFLIISESVDINNSVIGDETSVTELKVNEGNNKYKFEDGILFSKDGSKIYAYLPGKQEDTYVFDNNIKEIGDFAFYGCGNLKEINIPNTVNKVGGRAFDSCKNLTNIFVNASSLYFNTFRDDASLQNVTIGKNTTIWSYSVFQGSNKIPSITYLGTKDEWSNTLGKTSLWKGGNTSIKKIICSDGEINM